MPKKNICYAIVSVIFGCIALILSISGVALVCDEGLKLSVVVSILLFLALALGFALCTLAAAIGTYEIWLGLISCVKTAYTIITVLFSVLFGLAIVFLVWLLLQPINEMVGMLIGIDLYAAACIVAVILLSSGMALPVIHLYDEKMAYLYAPVKFASEFSQMPRPYEIVVPELSY